MNSGDRKHGDEAEDPDRKVRRAARHHFNSGVFAELRRRFLESSRWLPAPGCDGKAHGCIVLPGAVMTGPIDVLRLWAANDYFSVDQEGLRLQADS
jgi:hypothetical protein